MKKIFQGKLIVRPLADLRKSIPHRADGYIEGCLRIGKLDAATQTVSFTQEEFNQARQQYNLKNGKPVIVPGCC